MTPYPTQWHAQIQHIGFVLGEAQAAFDLLPYQWDRVFVVEAARRWLVQNGLEVQVAGVILKSTNTPTADRPQPWCATYGLVCPQDTQHQFPVGLGNSVGWQSIAEKAWAALKTKNSYAMQEPWSEGDYDKYLSTSLRLARPQVSDPSASIIQMMRYNAVGEVVAPRIRMDPRR